MQTLSRIWTWLKKYWKWLLFPIGLVMTLTGYIAGRKSESFLGEDTNPEIPKLKTDTLRDITVWTESTVEQRDEKLEQLKKDNYKRLKNLSQKQQEELEQLRDEPIKEIVQWFDRL
jgi:hypothetical protein